MKLTSFRMPQEFQVLQCYKCETFQVHQVKKALKWICKLCGEKQSVKKVYGRGSGVDCRKHVQQLNTRRGELSSLREVSFPTADSNSDNSYHGNNFHDNSYHDNSYHDNFEDLPDSERYTRPGISKWSQYSEVSEELGTSISDGDDDPQVTTDRNYFKNQKKAMKRKAKETTDHPLKYPKWEVSGCLDQTDSCLSGQLTHGSSIGEETENYSQHGRISQYPGTFTTKTEVVGGFNSSGQFKVLENRKQSRNNNISSHKALDQCGVGTLSKWGRYVQNKMNSIHEEENEENAEVYVSEEDYVGKNQGKTHKTDYETKMNDGTTHTGYKDSLSKWRRYAENETDSLGHEVKDTFELDKICSNENILTDSGAHYYDKSLKTVHENTETSSYSLQEHSQPYFAAGDRSRNLGKYAITDRQKAKEFDSDPISTFQDAINGIQKENLEKHKTVTSETVCNSSSKWSKFMVEGHSQSAVDDDDNSDDNFECEDIKDIIEQTDNSEDVIGQAYDSGIVTRQADDSEVVIGQAYDSGGITGQACDSKVITGQACGQAHVSGDTVSRNMALSCKDFTLKEISVNKFHQVADKTVTDDKNRIAASKSMPLKQLNIDGCSGPVHLDRGHVVKYNKTDQKYVKENLSLFSAGELADEDLEF